MRSRALSADLPRILPWQAWCLACLLSATTPGDTTSGHSRPSLPARANRAWRRRSVRLPDSGEDAVADRQQERDQAFVGSNLLTQVGRRARLGVGGRSLRRVAAWQHGI